MSEVKERAKDPFENPELLKPFLTCVDHSVSRETFSLLMDPKTDLLITEPRPSAEELPAYYESENYISHTDSNRSFIDKVYQWVKKYSLQRKFKMIQKLVGRKGKILDIGCGTGDLLSVFENEGWDITGVEPSSRARKLALKKVTAKDRVVAEITDLKKEDLHAFDVITMWHVLEHVPNLMEYVEILKSLLTPDGFLIIAVPNYKSHDAKHYKEYWAAYDVPRHLWHFSKRSIRHIFGQRQFEVVRTLPLIFDAYYVSLLSEKYKTGRSKMVSGFKNGLVSNLKARRSGEYSSMIYIIKNK